MVVQAGNPHGSDTLSTLVEGIRFVMCSSQSSLQRWWQQGRGRPHPGCRSRRWGGDDSSLAVRRRVVACLARHPLDTPRDARLPLTRPARRDPWSDVIRNCLAAQEAAAQGDAAGQQAAPTDAFNIPRGTQRAIGGQLLLCCTRACSGRETEGRRGRMRGGLAGSRRGAALGAKQHLLVGSTHPPDTCFRRCRAVPPSL